ncbi:MAG: Blue-light-activated protein [Syntrophorhabdus sp. PtaU1.Bin002]|nr:MAG: Blue-light-activated protein [Syntrophorhabdus sp. PtaU1.Bin002]
MQQLYINPEDWKRFREILDQYDFIEGNETQQVRRDGTKAWISTNARAVRDSKGKLLYYEGTIEDVTQRKHLESQLLQAQKLEAIGTLAGGIAHDFNNILTAVIGYGSLIHARMADSDPLRIYLDQLLSSSQKAVNLTQSLLVFSRKQVVELRPHKINKIVRGMEKILRRLLTEDIDFRVKAVEKDIIVMADVTQIDQVLLNLITNARDAMPEGGNLTIETKEVRIDEEFARLHGYGEPGSYALISVSDTGTGMDERTKAKIFEPFFTTKESGKGTGLGLSIVYGIVKQHGGYINVLSEPGEGTVFHIYFPAVKTKSEEVTHAPIDVKGGTETVLVAEDNSDIRGVLREVLGSKGYVVIEAEDGEDALRKFMEHQDVIDLVILDVVMPKRNGRQVCDEIRRAKAQVKVLFTSGYTGEVVIDKGVRGKAVDFIAKPVAPDDLLAKVRKVLDGR